MTTQKRIVFHRWSRGIKVWAQSASFALESDELALRGALKVVSIWKLAASVVASWCRRRAVVVEVVGKNSWGNHVEGTVTVALPAGS